MTSRFLESSSTGMPKAATRRAVRPGAVASGAVALLVLGVSCAASSPIPAVVVGPAGERSGPVAAEPARPRTAGPATIFDATVDQLRHAQAKITYLGGQRVPIETIAFHVRGHALSMDRFVQFQASPQPYGNDRIGSQWEVAVTPLEMRRMLAAVRPNVTSKGVGGGQEFLSFSVVAMIDGRLLGHEHLIGMEFADSGPVTLFADAAQGFYRGLLGALDAGNVMARERLNGQFIETCHWIPSK